MNERPQKIGESDEHSPYTPMLRDPVASSNGRVQCKGASAVRPVLEAGLSLDGAYPQQMPPSDDDVFRSDSSEDRVVRTAPPTPVRKTRSDSSYATKQSLSSKIDPKISTIRQHYYPEGEWGWIICVCGFVMNMMTTGLLLSYGILYGEVVQEFGEEYSMEAIWLGSMSLAVGLFVSPLIVAFCRRKSTRLTAVFGGLTSALGCLFTSFASQLHQVFFSYGIIMAIGLGMARETCNLMVGQYFKRRRDCVEIFVQSGIGVGVALFSFVYRKIIRILGWRLGLHAVTGIVVIPFFVGICYRSASLYHPQRRAILHLKNQRKKIKDKNVPSDKPPFFDFSTLSSRPVLVTMLAAALSSFGLYAPFFYFITIVESEGIDEQSILLLQLFLGSSFTIGCWIFGLLVVRRSSQCNIARQYLCQATMVGIGLAILSACAVRGYHGYVLFCWMYGAFCGGFHYTMKIVLCDRIRARNFNRAWGFVQWAQSVPVLVGIPITGYINRNQGPKTGFFYSAACAFAGAAAFFLLRGHREPGCRRTQGSCSTCTSAAPLDIPRDLIGDASGGVCTCTNSLLSSSQHSAPDPGGVESPPVHPKCQRSISFASSANAEEEAKKQELLTCISEEGLVDAMDKWCDAECVTSCDVGSQFLLQGVYEDGATCDDVIRTFHEEHRTCGQKKVSKHDPGVTQITKRPMTIIEEVTSSL